MTERRYEWLYGDELPRLMRERPVAWAPLGVLEEHGEHLPWGLDGLKAHAACLRLAEAIGGVVLPACHMAGIHGDAVPGREAEWRRGAEAAADMLYTQATFRALMRETFHGLANLGFRVIVAYTGHYPSVQTDALREVANECSGSGVAVIPFWEPLACGGGDHGGKWETSIFMALREGGARLEAVADRRTGEPGHYRGQRVGETASVALGEWALGRIEEYLRDAVDDAFRRLGRTCEQDA
ncbi:creatininase family protein [Candidatus Poribacteria bacterium]|jgi:creatinine amidohydrolase|nr:creatininase family protein [Candidatus Poribacteria bacterium]MBT5536566.1 creatininase family protein [Candidatus Poribacteria bacterium]MBT5713509.1 creatininase family protein [Candidatus Poribacteria bacterium]MBT7097643.1 creatininase family protein [Candidatus Poribacteria bacterium]MBT7806013.1 creatininase family protein [Candidatus Poribacteria bacterium]